MALKILGQLIIVTLYLYLVTASVRIEPDNPVYVESGTDFELNCTHSEQKEVKWQRKVGTFITPNDRVQIQVDPVTKTSTLKVKAAVFNDTGSYTCVHDSGLSPETFHSTVVVFDFLGESVLMPRAGSSLVLQCVVEGVNIDSITWFREDMESEVYEEMQLKDDKKYEISKQTDTKMFNSTLTIKEVEPQDAGEYFCQFEMKVPSKTFRHVVAVESPPFVMKFDKSKNVVQGDGLTLNCDVYGYPLPAITWLKDNNTLDVENHPRLSLKSYADIENASLVFKNMEFEDRALYKCFAENSLGSHESEILVRVKDKLAALWPFLGICAEVAILCLIIFIYERRRAKKLEEEDLRDGTTQDMINSTDHKGKDDIRHRK